MLINGIKASTIAATDRGLAYGDGLFSTIKVELGIVQLWSFHLARLKLGAQRLYFPAIDWQLLSDEIELLANTLIDKPQATIKVILTRGSGGRGYSSKDCDQPLRILSCHDFPEFYKQWQRDGINLILCEQRLSINPQLAGLKTLNRLEQVLIKHELEQKGALEGIVCDTNGLVIEACSANIFAYFDNQWHTPKLDGCGVKGVKRRQVIEAAEHAGVNITVDEIHIKDLLKANAICLTNALMGLVPVKQFQSHCYSISEFILVEELRNLLIEESRTDV